VRAVESVYAGDGTLSPAIARRLIALVAGDVDAGARQERARERLALLTEREREVARPVGQGRSNADIARELYVTVATVKAHVSRLLDKLDVENRVQIALLVHDAASGPQPEP
jgi:DNA-binding NarL/FixJ family response regulator